MNEPPTTDPRFFESLYFAIHEPNGAATLIVRLQTYPNMGVMDAHVIGVLGQRQYNLRLSRVIRNDREVTRIGPLTLEITEPMKRWRLALEDSSTSCTFDLEFAARMAPFDGAHLMPGSRSRNGISHSPAGARAGSGSEIRSSGATISLPIATAPGGSGGRWWGPHRPPPDPSTFTFGCLSSSRIAVFSSRRRKTRQDASPNWMARSGGRARRMRSPSRM